MQIYINFHGLNLVWEENWSSFLLFILKHLRTPFLGVVYIIKQKKVNVWGNFCNVSLTGSPVMQVCGEVLWCKSVGKFWDASLWGSIGMQVYGEVLGCKSVGTYWDGSLWKYWDASLWQSIGMQVCCEVLGLKSVVKYWDASLWGSIGMQVCGEVLSYKSVGSIGCAPS